MIRLKKGERIYSRYEISVILFAMTMLWLMPLILVFTYVFSFDLRLNIDTFLFFTILFVFVVEVVSDLVQVAVFKATGGRRVFRMAPIHHHYEALGWPEVTIVRRFWMAGVASAGVGLLALVAFTSLR